MPVVRQKWILRHDLIQNRDRLYVFGDNMARRGLGGQAAEMRGEPNAVGIPTKWAPAMQSSCMFRDKDLNTIKLTLDLEFERLRTHLEQGKTVVIPEDGIGTGLANLRVSAPKIFEYINGKLRDLEEITKS